MPIIKCKMCGGDVKLSEDKTFGTCEFCGSTMTFPKVQDSNEQRIAAFNRGNYFRRIGEFDKALAVYERIVQEDDTDAEAHWCCALCRYGIEYVEDPVSLEWLPTCHRASFDNFLEDVDYLAALKNSDGVTRRQYQKDAAKIAEVQRGILATSRKEEPFDVFICYKESDENGNRTKDSLLAQEIYYQLTDQGRRVFFSRITLEDKVGTEYEPYIFAALQSAKVMVVVGTKPEYFNAVWVKNEWSRFLALMKKDRSKLLLPCYRDMEPYDLPDALSVLQSYDMSKIGFLQDLTHGISKVLDADKTPELAPMQGTTIVQSSVSSDAQVKRGNLALADHDWEQAKIYFNQALDLDAECGEAYLGIALAEHQCSDLRELKEIKVKKASDIKGVSEETPIQKQASARIQQAIQTVQKKYPLNDEDSVKKLNKIFSLPEFMYQYRLPRVEAICSTLKTDYEQDKWLSKAFRFAKGTLADDLQTYIRELNAALDEEITSTRKEENEVIETSENEFGRLLTEAIQTAEELGINVQKKKEETYQVAMRKANTAKNIDELKKVILLFESLEGYKDSNELAYKYRARVNRKKKIYIGIIIAMLLVFSATALIVSVVHNNQLKQEQYLEAMDYYDNGEYTRAESLFEELGAYQDSVDMINACKTAATEAEQAEYQAFLNSLENYNDYSQAQKIIGNHLSTEGVVEGEYENDPYYCYASARLAEAEGRLDYAWYRYQYMTNGMFDSSNRASNLEVELDQQAKKVIEHLYDDITKFADVKDEAWELYCYENFFPYYSELLDILDYAGRFYPLSITDFSYVCCKDGTNAYLSESSDQIYYSATMHYRTRTPTATYPLLYDYESDYQDFSNPDDAHQALANFAQEHGGEIVTMTDQELAWASDKASEY